MQFELQNFFSFCQLGGLPIERKRVGERHNKKYSNFTNDGKEVNDSDIRDPDGSSFSFLNDYIAPAILTSTTLDNLFENLVNISAMDVPQPSISVPLYDRAYPTRGYAKDMFWHNLGTILSVTLVIYFSIPSALTAKDFSNGALKGQFDSLLTLPGVTMHVLCTTAVASCWITSFLPFLLVSFLFSVILKFTSPLIPVIALLLMSFSLGSIAVVISTLTKNVEAAVVMVPTTVFLMALPGMVYYDLAFDVQRTVLVESILCLLPPSAAIIILRSVCTMESLSLPLRLSTTSLVSNVPIATHMVLLVLDGAMFYAIAMACSWYQFQIREKNVTTLKAIQLEGVDATQNPGDAFGFVRGMTHVWQEFMSKDISFGTAEYELLDVSGNGAHAPMQNQYYQCEQSEDSTIDVGLVVSKVSKSYVSTEKECQIQVLSHIDACLHSGRVTTLLGSNGGGKTTLLRILGGFDSSYEGSVHYINEAAVHRRIVGWCSQNDALYEFLTIREHVEMFCAILVADGIQLTRLTACSRSIAEGITVLLSSLELLEHQDKYPAALSGGMKRRLSLALAALGDPMLLLLDEPTSGCDR